MNLYFQPYTALPLYLVVIAVVAVSLVLMFAWAWRRAALSRRSIILLILQTIASGCFVVASCNPLLATPADIHPQHVVLLLDVSDSVLRAPDAWGAVAKRVRALLADAVGALKETQGSSASIITFGNGITERNFPLDTLLDEFDRLDPTRDFANGDASDIGAGLQRARELIADADGRGNVILVTDGHDTEGHAQSSAELLARIGIPIHVIPVQSEFPQLAITSANLNNQVDAGVPATLRGVIYNNSDTDLRGVLSITQNAGLATGLVERFGPEQATSATYDPLSAGRYHPLRLDVTFEGLGIEFIDLALENGTTAPHRRRIFTHVNRPINLLAIGSNFSWLNIIPEDFARITTYALDQNVSNLDLSEYDGVILSEAPGKMLDAGLMQALADGVVKDGRGLFVINGDHNGASEETRTILGSYEGTPIQPILPVSTVPRPTPQEPPPRHIVILIDISGSMAGQPLEIARNISRSIIDLQLREQDYLDLIAFDTTAYHLVENRLMDAAGKNEANRQLDTLFIGGGTDPYAALQLIIDRQMSNCGLIFITDGIFSRDVAQSRPDCRTTLFLINSPELPNASLRALADPIVVGANFDPRRISIPFFQPEIRDKHFENGSFLPLPLPSVYETSTLPIPNLELNGAAITFPLDGAEIAAVRPRFVDPVLAYKQSGAGTVGVFTTGFPTSWSGSAEASNAVQEWIQAIVAYAARDRYDFTITDQGDRLTLHIELKAKDGTFPVVDQLSAVLELSNDTIEFSLSPVDGAPSTFEGTAIVPRTSETLQGILVLDESGKDALPRPQRIPILIPMAGQVDAGLVTEASNYGLNESLLVRIAEMSGGEYNPVQGNKLLDLPIGTASSQPLWYYFIALGALSYLAAIGLHKTYF